MRLFFTAKNQVPTAIGGLLLVALIFLSYLRVCNAGFIWDDEAHLTENPCIIGPLGFAQIWTSAQAVYYPLVLTTFWVLHKFVGLNPLPYHLLNVVFHAVSALLLWRVLHQLRIPAAWLGAAIWALHPVMVQSVAWVTETKNTESGVFYLLSISLFLQWRGRSEARTPGRDKGIFALALLSFVAALVSKPSTVMLPVVLVLCVWWREGKIDKRLLVQLLPFLLASLAVSAWTIWEQKFHAGASGSDWVQTPLQRVLISSRAIWFYLFKLIWPQRLTFIYPRWSANDGLNYVSLVMLVAAATLLTLRRKRELRAPFLAFACFVATLFPVLDFFDIYFFRFSFVSNHFQYLAAMAPLALAAPGYLIAERHFSNSKVIVRLGSATLLLLLAALTFHQTGKYTDAETLYRATLAENPQCWMADYNLGLVLRERGDLEGAIAHYERAIATKPDYVEAHYNLAGALVDKGEIDKALVHYERAIVLRPDDPDSHNNYGTALRQLGQLNQAQHEYERALGLRADYFDARLNLGTLLLQRGRPNEAITNLEQAIRLAPNDAGAHTGLGNALMKAKRAIEAKREFETALKFAPDHVAALNSLAWLLATSPDPNMRDGGRAVELAQRGQQLTRNQDPIILHTLAAALAEAGRFDEALEAARAALRRAEANNNEAIVKAIRDELPLYELGLPYHQAKD